MLKTKYGSYDGNSWEAFCQACLKMKYHDDGYQELPAWQGDMGIEGYTRTGIVFQCYCPDDEYGDSKLYEKQRDKVTTDLKKLENREKELKIYLGTIKIEKWYFLTPIIKNKKLISHCMIKADEYKNKGLEILSENFDVLAYDIDLFLGQIPYILPNINSKKLEINNLEIIKEKDIIKWKDQSNSLVENTIRKQTLRLPENAQNKESKINKLTDNTIKDFIEGNLIIQKWSEIYQSDFEKFHRIIGLLEKEVEEDCMLNTINNDDLYNNIKLEVKTKLTNNFYNLDELTIDKLTNRVMADWILRCPINFE